MSTLDTVAFGRTGMVITRTGFGAWAIGGGDWVFGWGPQDDGSSIAAIRRALELGVNWIDTAAAYGYGHSEEVVARALQGLPEADRPYVFTKCGLVADPADRYAPALRVGDPSSIRAEVEASLRRLSTERIDLLHMHWPPADRTPLEVYWSTLLDLEREGKIRAAAMSNHGVGELGRAEALGHVAAVQPHFSAITRGAAADVIPWAAAHETGVIVYSPMESGLLTGAFTAERVAGLDPGDWRRASPDFQGARLAANLELAGTFALVAGRHGATTAAVAVAWTLAFEGVSGAIVGARSPEQVDGWIGAATLHLTDGDLAELAGAIERTGAGSGPVSPSTVRDG